MPHFFEERPPRRVARREFSKQLLRSWDASKNDDGIEIFLIGFGTTDARNRETLVYHASETEDVVAVDETARMRIPPEEAMFYLAEVRTGSCVDFTIDGEYADTGKRLSVLFTEGSASLSDLEKTGRYQVDVRGLGVKDVSRQGIFSQSIDDIATHYRADPATIELVFRTVPGRSYKPKKVPMPQVLVDKVDVKVPDGSPVVPELHLHSGRYLINGKSEPNGIALRWSSNEVSCDHEVARENQHLSTTCTLAHDTDLLVWNWSEYNMGAAETVDIYIARLP